MRWRLSLLAVPAALLAFAAPASANIVSSHITPKPRITWLIQEHNVRPVVPVYRVNTHVRLRQVRPGGPAGSVGPALGKIAPAGGPRDAIRSLGTPWGGSPNLPPATTTGKVFFTDHTGGHWVCSGSLVNSAGKDLVITAGHCVYGTAGGELPRGETWHSNWVFAPDYSNGKAPFGFWSARQLWTMTNYVNNGDEQDDIGAAILNMQNGQHAVNLLGGQGYAWNQTSSHFVWDFGYPAAAPFNGQIDEVCNGGTGYGIFINMETLGCNFTGGSSGGPWLMSFNGELGYVNGVNDARYGFPYSGDITSLYFGNNALALYNATKNL